MNSNKPIEQDELSEIECMKTRKIQGFDIETIGLRIKGKTLNECLETLKKVKEVMNY